MISYKDSILLSICICTISERSSKLNRILESLESQSYPEVEVLWLGDNFKRNVGEKRNALASIANGKYIVFIDDDDMISDDYVSRILDAIKKSFPDVVSFNLQITIDGGKPKDVFFSKEYGENYNLDDCYLRTPNHIMAIKKEIYEKVKVMEVIKGGDFDFAQKIMPYLNTEEKIHETLYFYEFDSELSRCVNPRIS